MELNNDEIEKMKIERKSANQENDLLRREVVRLEEINRKISQSAVRTTGDQPDKVAQNNVSLDSSLNKTQAHNGQEGDKREILESRDNNNDFQNRDT